MQLKNKSVTKQGQQKLQQVLIKNKLELLSKTLKFPKAEVDLNIFW